MTDLGPLLLALVKARDEADARAKEREGKARAALDRIVWDLDGDITALRALTDPPASVA